MSPIADLREAVRSLSHVPDGTPVEPTIVFGAPNALVYDAPAGVVRLSVGWGRATGRPTMGQLRSWLGLPLPDRSTPAVAGVWESATATEPFNWRGLVVFASAVASGFHGTRRNGGSIFWGLIWFGLGAALPGVVPVVALAQGFGECANNCRQAPTQRR